MDRRDIPYIKVGDVIEWTGKDPDTFEVITRFPGNPPSSYGYEYMDYSYRMKSLIDGHDELIGGDDLENIHFIQKRRRK